MSPRRRLDAELVRRGLASSRNEAAVLIRERRVLVDGVSADKVARLVASDENLVVTGPPRRFVSRGGDKLDAAISAFALDVRGLRALDVGASTGGFTDCLLQRGVGSVVALDVGHGQLDMSLRNDPRVDVRERFNIRDADPLTLPGPFDIVVCDVSFISLRRVVPAVLRCCAPGSVLVLLVKPQFEAGRAEVSRGSGVIRDPEVWQRVCHEIDMMLAESACDVIGWIDSPITGAKGNREFLVAARVR